MNHRISIIAAIDEKRGLGHDNDLLFKIPEDMKRLRQLTVGRPLVMGRKTFISLPKRLLDRTHIVVTHDPASLNNNAFKPDIIVGSLEEGIEAAKKAQNSDEIFIFGGGKIFTEAVEKGLADRLYLTIVKGDYGADTFFPKYTNYAKIIEHEKREEDGYTYSFLTLEKS